MQFKQSLHSTIFAILAMQSQECRFNLFLFQFENQILIDINQFSILVAQSLQCGETVFSRAQRNFALIGQAAAQNTDPRLLSDFDWLSHLYSLHMARSVSVNFPSVFHSGCNLISNDLKTASFIRWSSVVIS